MVFEAYSDSIYSTYHSIMLTIPFKALLSTNYPTSSTVSPTFGSGIMMARRAASLRSGVLDLRRGEMVNSPALAAALVLKGMSLTLQGVGVVPSKVGGSKPDNLIMETEDYHFFWKHLFSYCFEVFTFVFLPSL